MSIVPYFPDSYGCNCPPPAKPISPKDDYLSQCGCDKCPQCHAKIMKGYVLKHLRFECPQTAPHSPNAPIDGKWFGDALPAGRVWCVWCGEPTAAGLKCGVCRRALVY